MSRRVVALVAARNEAGRIGSVVSALLPFVDDVVVVDDDSTDATGTEATAAGATVLRSRGRSGKGGALEGALRRLEPADVWLLADGDLGATAAGLVRLVEVVSSDGADLAIAVLPPALVGGFGLVKRTSAHLIRGQSGFRASEPLSGQRALTARAMQAVRPLAHGFGVETAMTIDAVRAGLRVLEVPIGGLEHRPTYRNLRGFLHRGRQGWDIAMAVLPRVLR
ncbi:MAG TPA: glycosyltransferase [Actinomycetota bacterium]|nr:glycosyltransferase [Actinomycetota bacterium]